MKVSQQTLMPVIEALIKEGKSVTFKVKGHSMWPFYKDAKTDVTIEKKPYKKMDVLLASYQDRYILHRLIKIKGEKLILKGDGAFLKEVIEPKDVIGVVTHYKTKKTVLEQSNIHKLLVYIWVYNPFRTIIMRIKK